MIPPLGMSNGDPTPMAVSRTAPSAFVGEVVTNAEMTGVLQAAQARAHRFQMGSDTLFAQLPACLEFFGFPCTTPEHLRSVAQLGTPA